MDLRRSPCWTLVALSLTLTLHTAHSSITWEVQRYDGWYNNLAYHRRGAAGAPFMRLLPARYSDGSYQPLQELPNARLISNAAMSGDPALLSIRNQTVLSVFFGYHVVLEIAESRIPGCPPEFMHIPVSPNDPVHGSNSSTHRVLLPFQRAQWDQSTGKSPNNPRTQVNHVTAWIDGSSIYGSSSSWSDALRSFQGGLLSSGSDKNMPKQSDNNYFMWSAPNPCNGETGPEGLYEFGNAWANENIFTVAEGIIWFRYHNYLASQLHEDHPSWSDEELFQNARKRVIATFQNIAFYEWLPAYLGVLVPPYPGYQKYVDPGVSPEFQAAAVRFGLTLVPPGVYMRNRTCHYRSVVNFDGRTSPAVRLCNSFWNRNNPNLKSAQDVDDLIMGMASQIAEREDNVIVEDLRDYMYGTLKFSRSDAAALTIQRGRDFGLPSYNEVREALNLSPVQTWGEINPKLNQTNPQLFKDLSELYKNDISKLELFVGALLEGDGGPGPVVTSIFLDQFDRIRNADRFWFENKQNGLFTEEEIQSIRNTTYYDILLAITSAESEDIQKNVFFWLNGDPCPQPQPVTASDLQPCTKATSMSYFDTSSKAGYGIVVIILFFFPVVSLLVAYLVAKIRAAKYRKFLKRTRGPSKDKEPNNGITACEWQGYTETPQPVSLVIDKNKRLHIYSENANPLRSHNLGNQEWLEVLLSNDHQQRALLLKIPKEYDLVLFFEDSVQRSEFIGLLHSDEEGMTSCLTMTEMSEKELLKEAVTKEQRAQIVETFFRQAFAKVLEIDRSDAGDLSGVSSKRTREVLQCELTAAEFACALGLRPDSLFVESMFSLADKDGNGYLSFQEFLDVLVIFMKGTPEEKSKLLFSMHDIRGDGFLSKEDFCSLLRSFLEISSNVLSKSQAEDATAAMLQAAGFDDKEYITWEDFHLLLKDHENVLKFAQLNIKGMEMHSKNRQVQPRVSFMLRDKNSSPFENEAEFMHNCPVDFGQELRQRKKLGFSSPKVYVKPQRERYIRSPVQQKIQHFKRFVENYRRHIVCLVVIYGITAGVALDRCWYYGLQADSSGVPETSIVGIIVSRGSAAAISFLFPYMLLTVCRNLITIFRETFLNRYIPFDSAIDLHRLMAMTAIILTVVHSLGHVVNVYIFCISDLSILACLFPKVFSNNGSELPLKWTFWIFATVPGLTGVILLLILAFMYVFATHYFRRISFRGFWITHYFYVLVYALTVIHGSFALLQEPRFYIYLIPPALLYLLDKLISLSRKKVEIPVVKAELLPSGVTYLEFKRPQGFAYRSGQWVRVACLELGTDEYHPFTLTSAPHEDTLSLHIRAVGPWTSKLREVYNPDRLQELGSYPKLYLDGPFGEGHQEWKDFEVSVLVGGGIGVTPFASILKDLVFKSSTKLRVQCKKVYFIWVTRTQRQFEWVSDIIREVEEMDDQELVSVHIYITQLAEKFDLRTTMLYVCERHFQKVWNRSLFTGLRSVTHFGRPPFLAFFSSLQEVHPEVGKIGVFSCGPPGLTKNVEKACQQMNKRDQAYFIHHYENF
ncbi:dual oxidase 2 [Pygocentrus nattereri]|uniref:NAD(P)H oxidase (H2O2-forming) n=1 Tax=Pygocentrus nattereri TaxID=42514 RepID=A0A3B4CLI0_PYGNA|nr:dual oxidase 2 [Pygocentrus nattereri]